jgi:outer membrane protein TolC
VVSLDEKRKTVLRYETLLVTLLRQVEDAFKTGISLKNDVLKVRQKKSEVELNRSRIENGRELAFMSFCQYIGIAYDPSIILTDRVVITDTPETFRVKNEKEAVASRTESHLLQKSVAAEALKTQIKRGEYMPEVSVGMASLYTQFDDRKHDDNGMVFATAAIPLSGWWEASYTMKERALREKMETNRQKETTDLLLLQIKKAWKDVEEAFKQVGLCETSRTQAEENLSLSKDSYVNGIVDIADLLEAQAIFQKSEEELIEAKVNYRIKKILYLKTTGQRF